MWKKYDCFISHASEDNDEARKLLIELTGLGLHCWYDEKDLSSDEPFPAPIRDALNRSRVFAAILSESYFAKPWPKQELRMWLERGGVGFVGGLKGITKEDVPPEFAEIARYRLLPLADATDRATKAAHKARRRESRTNLAVALCALALCLALSFIGWKLYRGMSDLNAQLQSQLDTIETVIQLRHMFGPDPAREFPRSLHQPIMDIEESLTARGVESIPNEGVFYLAQSAFLRAEYGTALQYAEAAVVREPGWSQASYLLGDVLARHNRFQEAIPRVSFSLPTFEWQYLRTLRLLADMHRLNQQAEQAVPLQKKLTRLGPGDHGTLNLLGYTALQAAEEALPRSQQKAQAFLKEATDAYAAVLKDDPGDAVAVFGTGLVAEAKGDADSARQRYEEALGLQTQALTEPTAQKYFDKARMLAKLGRADEALKTLQQCLQLDPTYRVYAKRDRELAPLMHDPRFEALVSGPACGAQ